MHAHPCFLRALTVLTNGTNDATVTLHDNATAASGTVLAKAIVAGADFTGHITFPQRGVAASNGIYATLAGTGCECIVYYETSTAS